MVGFFPKCANFAPRPVPEGGETPHSRPWYGSVWCSEINRTGRVEQVSPSRGARGGDAALEFERDEVGDGAGPRDETAVPVDEAARKRVAVETFARHEEALWRAAARHSLCADDADEALQRALRDPPSQGAFRRPRGARPLQPDGGQARGASRFAPSANGSSPGPPPWRPDPAARTGCRCCPPSSTGRPNGPSTTRRSSAAARRWRR